MIVKNKKAAGIISAFGLVVIIFVGIFGLTHSGMSMEADGSMGNCPFTLGTSICGMSPLQHLDASKNLLTVLPQKELVSFASILASIFFAFLFAWFLKINSPPRLLTLVGAQSGKRPIFHNYLLEAFSNGILNPKLF